MVISKDGKRKRKEINLIDSSPEVPKRIKVHAQRKFAQGQGTSSTYALGLPTLPQTATTIKEPREPPPELITNKRPNTDDFLTFLCFRGTSILPPNLDFFNSQNRTTTTSSSTSPNTTNTVNTETAATPNAEATNNVSKTEVIKDDKTVEKSKEKEPPGFIPFGVRKRAEQIPEPNCRQTVQALKKKYHEQRMAKLKTLGKANKQQNIMRTRSNKVIEAISKRNKNETKSLDSNKAKKELKTPIATTPVSKAAQNKRKIDLRSASSTTSLDQSVQEKQTKHVKVDKQEKTKVQNEVEVKKQPKEIFVKKDLNKNKEIEKSVVKKKINVLRKDISIHSNLRNKNKLMKKIKVNKTKQVSAVAAAKVIRVTRLMKTLNRVTDDTKSETNTGNKISDTDLKESETEEEFSTDDDQPLAISKKPDKSNSSSKNAIKAAPAPIKAKKLLEKPVPKILPNRKNVFRRSAITPPPESSPSPQPKPATPAVESETKDYVGRSKIRLSKRKSRKRSESKSDESSKMSSKNYKIKEVIKKEKGKINDKTNTTIPNTSKSKSNDKTYTTKKCLSDDLHTTPSKSDNESITKVVKVSKNKKTNFPNKNIANSNEKLNNDSSQANLTDLSENENRIRPTRKTKEAATIYMELIGRKLNLQDDLDEDDTSIDSFPELPNVRKTQQMENELKANVGKEKPIGKEKPVIKKKIKTEYDSYDEKVKENDVKKNSTKLMQTKGNCKSEEIKKVDQLKKVVKSENIKTEKLEKSFSDSDEEPLATKLINYKVKPFENANRKSLISSVEMEPIATMLETSPCIQKEISPIKQTPEESHKSESSNVITKTPDPKMVESDLNVDEKIATVSTQPETTKLTKTKTSVAKNISRTDSNAIKNKIIHLTDTKLEMPLHMAVQWYNQQMTPRSPAHPNQYGTSSLRSLMNPLPSKEESGKIFGIASVTLAQSSGPMDTKCTLGKCGSIHKPPLGPVFPTETLLIDNLSTKERRRAKVNMTQEQIEKWLVECSSEPEEILDDLEIDEIDLKSTPKPINYLQAPSPTREIILPTTKNNKAREKLSQITKGPTLKAMAVTKNIAADDDAIVMPTKNNKNNKNTKTSSPNKEIEYPIKEKSLIKKPAVSKEFDNKATPLPEPSIQTKIQSPATGVTANETTPQKIKAGVQQKTKSPQKSPSKLSNTAITPKPGTLDRKPIFNQRRTPVYSNKQQELIKSTKSKGIVNTFGAFSPENEHSIYSFDKEDDFIPAATPFRRQSHKESKDDIERTPIKKEQTNATTSTSPLQTSPGMAGMVTPTKSLTQDQQQVSLTLSPEDNSKSASITVQLNLDSEIKSKSNLQTKQITTDEANEKQTCNDGNESDNDGHTFYIPLQGTNMTGSKTDQLIQGVAVKLGTEGPEGCQRVIMHAKLVTKAQMGQNPTPMPESMANVQEIVKSLIASKEASGSKSVPIGTVQPRFKSGDTIAGSSSKNLPSTSNTTSKATNELKRVNSSSSLISQKSKPSKAAKIKNDTPIQPSNNTAFPWLEDPTQMVEAPTFTPTEKEFQDPIEFIERITPIAARFGICRIIPPTSFKPECRVSDDMRFTAYNQYVHKMLHRWGPSAKEFSAIKKYLATQSITLTHPPWIGGMEVDLPRMYHTVQELGGLSEVIEKKKWARVAEEMCIPKSAQDRVTKLDDIYCKYLLPYDTLSPAERQKLFDEVEADWAKREAKARRNADKRINLDSNSIDESEEEEEDSESEEGDGGSMECIVKGRSMALNAFFRIARNTMALWFKNTEPTAAEVEAEFWRHVAVRDSHVCVHSGSIDSSGWGYGFPTPGPKGKTSPCSKHPWNLKVFTNNSGSVLRSLGPVMGVTVPTLYVGMLFSACCWYRDPHGLPWIEYLHTGANKIWYGVPDEQSTNFRAALTSLVPTHCQNKKIWLPCDTAMVPPHMLTDRGVSLCRTEQQPGQFVIVFPRAYTSSISTGYVVSESVSFATNKWLESAEQDFKDIQASCEPTTFSLEQLLFAIASDQRSNNETLSQILPMITEVYEKEVKYRQDLKVAGVTINEKLQTKGKKQILEENECELCRTNLFISMLKTDDDLIYCLKHGLQSIENKQLKITQLKLIYTYSIDDIKLLIKRLKERLNIQQNNSNNNINNNQQQQHQSQILQQQLNNNNKNVKKTNSSAISSCIINNSNNKNNSNNNMNSVNNTNKKK